jgi:hypothetical protein
MNRPYITLSNRISAAESSRMQVDVSAKRTIEVTLDLSEEPPNWAALAGAATAE